MFASHLTYDLSLSTDPMDGWILSPSPSPISSFSLLLYLPSSAFSWTTSPPEPLYSSVIGVWFHSVSSLCLLFFLSSPYCKLRKWKDVRFAPEPIPIYSWTNSKQGKAANEFTVPCQRRRKMSEETELRVSLLRSLTYFPYSFNPEPLYSKTVNKAERP